MKINFKNIIFIVFLVIVGGFILYASRNSNLIASEKTPTIPTSKTVQPTEISPSPTLEDTPIPTDTPMPTIIPTPTLAFNMADCLANQEENAQNNPANIQRNKDIAIINNPQSTIDQKNAANEDLDKQNMVLALQDNTIESQETICYGEYMQAQQQQFDQSQQQLQQ